MGGKRAVLFLCTGNSCRSQMAEGFCRSIHGDAVDAFSAGIEAQGLNPHAVEVMAEVGIDISRQVSKRVADLQGMNLDLVITICSHADETCPAFPGRTTVVHRDFDDPPALARQATSREVVLAHYRRVRDEIRDYVSALPEVFKEATS